MGYLIDTSAAILLRDADTDIDSKLPDLEEIPALSIISRIELEGGVVAQPALASYRGVLLDRMLALFPVLPFDDACAAAYRAIVSASGFSRRKTFDRMIAATALAHDLTLITANPADFRDVPGLALIVW